MIHIDKYLYIDGLI